MRVKQDNLAPMRGIVTGLALSVVIWAAVVFAVRLVF
jgi:hypothetical protein